MFRCDLKATYERYLPYDSLNSVRYFRPVSDFFRQLERLKRMDHKKAELVSLIVARSKLIRFVARLFEWFFQLILFEFAC